MTVITLNIQNNTINFLERFWIRIETWAKVLVTDNHFGEYHQMAIENTKNPEQCLFENNFITKAPSESLNFKSPHCRVRQISFNEPCSCDPGYFKLVSYNDLRSESYCTIDELLTHCFNASLFNVLSYENDFCGNKKEIDCFKSRVNAKKNGGFVNLQDLLNNKGSKLLYVYIIGGSLLLLLLLVLLFVLLRCCCRRCQSKNVEESANRDIMIMESLHRPPMFRQRSPSYSQSDVTVIEKTLQRMRMKYPPEIYDQVYNNTVKLVAGNLSETDKVSTIGEIIRNLTECENRGTDFVEFIDILYMHLGPEVDQEQRGHDPIYFEPNAPPMDDDNSSYGDNASRNTTADRTSLTNGNSVVGGEHIYAEPVNLQQPLLRSEYTVPIDRKNSIAHVYTEPISRAIGEDSTLFCIKCTFLLAQNDQNANVIYSNLAIESVKNLNCTCQAKLNDLFSGFIYS